MRSNDSPAYAALKHRLDKVFSEYIRRKHADSRGDVRCVTCGRPGHWKSMDCGHFIKRGNVAVRWDERNAGPQCQMCNRCFYGRPVEFEKYIRETHGNAVVIELREKKYTSVKFGRDALNEKISEIKSRIAALPPEDRAVRW